MKKILALAGMFAMSSVFSFGVSALDHGYMKMDSEKLKRWKAEDAKFPRRSAPLKSVKKGSVDLLPHFNYSAATRDQGNTGTCWAWATQAVMSMDLDIKKSIKLENGLSMQLIASNAWMVGADLDSGGTVDMARDFYQMLGYNIPWENTNAGWTDGDGKNNTKSSWIYTSPSVPLSKITVTTIETFGESVTKEQAIANVKSALDAGKPVWFAYMLANDADWNTFGNFWNDQPQTAIINLDYGQGHELTDDGGGHAVACVGYNDEDPDPAKHYWTMLNSWGNDDGGRPEGTFRIAMDTNYNATIEAEDPEDSQMFWFYTFDTDFTDEVSKGVSSVTMNMGDVREDSDSIKFTKVAYAETNPAAVFSAELHINSFTFDLDGENGAWTANSKGGFTFKSLKKTYPQISLDIDAKKKTWSFSMSKADEYRYLNPIDGLMFYLEYREADDGILMSLGGKHAFMLDEIDYKSQSKYKE